MDRAQDSDLTHFMAKMKNHLRLSQIYAKSKYLVTLHSGYLYYLDRYKK